MGSQLEPIITSLGIGQNVNNYRVNRALLYLLLRDFHENC